MFRVLACNRFIEGVSSRMIIMSTMKIVRISIFFYFVRERTEILSQKGTAALTHSHMKSFEILNI